MKFSIMAIAGCDAEVRFRSMAARGAIADGLKLVDKLNRALARQKK